MIPFSYRFHGHNSLRFVYRNGRATRTRLMTIKVTENSHRKISRVAVVVGKKIFKSAVRRNRIRRRLYEYIRLNLLPEINKVYDIVLIVSSGDVLQMTSDDLEKHLEQLFTAAHLYKTSES